MANIKNYLDNIKNAIFGKDVRGSIHDGIDAINKEVEETSGRQVDLENTFDQLIINAGNSNAEIVDARVKEDGTSYPKLGARLDYVDSQLDDISINIKKFGALGDGITNDDSPVLEADSKGGVLLFPPGRYILSKPPLSLCYGVGATLVVENGYEMILDSKPLEVSNWWQTYIRLNNTDLGINAGKKLNLKSDRAYGNVCVGNNALQSAETGVWKNVAIGHNSLSNVTDAYQNVVVGTDACRDTVLAERNTIIGGNAGLGMGDDVIVGKNHMFREDVDTTYLDLKWPSWREYAGQETSPNVSPKSRSEVCGNTGIGRNSLGWTIKPKFCTALGYNTLEKALEGYATVSIGVNSCYNSIKSDNTVSIGFNANSNNSTNNGDVSIGSWAMNNVPHSKFNVAIGYQALKGDGIDRVTDAICDNIAIGRFAMANPQGQIMYNVGIGAGALRYNEGSFNTAIGQQAAQENVNGLNNTAVGVNAARSLINNKYYTAIGANALNNADFEGFENITGIGQNSSVTGSNQLQLGNSETTPMAFNPLQLRSDARDKLDIKDTKLGLDFINKLRPVEYRVNFRESYIDYDEDGNVIKVENDGSRSGIRKHQGLIAQEVKHVMDELGVDFAGYQDHKFKGGHDTLSLSYMELIAPLVKSIQELSSKVKILELNNSNQ